MARKKVKYEKKSFESLGNNEDTSANIYVSMLMSQKWKKLTKNAQVLYLYCKAQYYAEKRKPLPQIDKAVDNRNYFTMNKSKWLNLYGIYSTDNGQFAKDMRLLVESGFIDVIENGQITRTKSIYAFSCRWKEQ